jgi:phosphoribosylanthranilate isomerase
MSFPADLQDVMVKLEFLSQITEGCKINTKDMSLSPASSWLSSIKRTITHEDRNLTVHYINEVIRETTQIIGRYRDNNDYITIILDAFSRAKTGIENLTVTYQASPDIIANIRVMIAGIELQLRNIRNN